MKSNPKNHLARSITAAFTAAFLTHFITPSAQAAALTWSGGDGDWQDTVVGGWSAAWNNVTPDSGTFAGAGGTVGVLGPITTFNGTAPLTGGLTFAGSGNYTLSASGAQSITVGATGNSLVSIASGRTGIIGSNVTLQRPASAGGWYLSGGGTLEIATGGAFTNASTNGNEIANGTTLRINGGAVTLAGSLAVGQLTGSAGAGATGNLIVDSGSLTIGGAGNLAIGRLTADDSIATLNNGTITVAGGNLAFGGLTASPKGTFNLNGGTLEVKRVLEGTGTPNSTFSFNGGTLKAAASATGATFMTGLNTARIRNGAAVIDTNGQAITIGQLLSHSAISGDNPIDGGLTLNDSAVTKGTLSLTAASTYNGPTRITAGILSLDNILAIQNSSLDTLNSVTGTAGDGLKTTVTTLTFGGLTGNKNLADVFTTTSGGYSGVTALTLNPGTGVTHTYSGDITNGVMTLTKTGAGAQTLSGANTHDSLTTISTGALIAAANNALGTTLAGTTVSPSASLGLSGNIDYTTTETITGSGLGSAIITGVLPAVSRGLIQSVSGNNTFRGNIVVDAGGVSRIGAQDGASLTLTGTITQATGSILFRAGSGLLNAGGDFITLSNAGNSFGGNSTIFTNATTGYSGVRLGIANALPTGLTISGLGGGTPTAAGTALDLYGSDQSLNGLIGAATLNIINTNTGTPSTLTLNPTADQSTAGTVILGGTGLSGPLETINLIKEGTFSQTLAGVNTYTGTTAINGGTLVITGATLGTSAITFGGGKLGLNTAFPVTAVNATVNFTGQSVLVTGTTGAPSYTLFTANLITGTPTLAAPAPSGYALQVVDGVLDELRLVQSASAYDLWKADNAPGSNPDDDSDGDGVSNAVEFVLGGTSATNDLGKMPKIDTDGTNMTFTFKRIQSSVDPKTTLFIEVSTELATWNTSPSPYSVPDGVTAGPPVAVVNNGDGTDTVTLTVAQSPDAKKFARLKVVITP